MCIKRYSLLNHPCLIQDLIYFPFKKIYYFTIGITKNSIQRLHMKAKGYDSLQCYTTTVESLYYDYSPVKAKNKSPIFFLLQLCYLNPSYYGHPPVTATRQSRPLILVPIEDKYLCYALKVPITHFREKASIF